MADPTLHVTTIQWLSSLHKIMAKDKTRKIHPRPGGDEADPGGIDVAGV